MFEFLIRNGTVVDGTGNVGFKADVVVNCGRLTILRSDSSSVEARATIDASGCIVCPGFIDVHTHSDLMALAEPKNEPKTMMGVTTDLIGLDGMGYAPLSQANLKKMLILWSGVSGYPQLGYDWSSVNEYLARFDNSTSTNIGSFVPNSCLRAQVVGWDNRRATAGEIRHMQEILRQSMREGALGMSTGLTYLPGSYATTDELIELCKTTAECGGVYVTHVRYDLGDCTFDGFREAIKIGTLSGCPVHISHYATNLATRGRAKQMLSLVDEARDRGIDVTFDSYPWPAGSSYLSAVLPPWAQDGGPDRLIACLQDEETRDRMSHQAAALVGAADQLVVSAVRTERNRWCEGLTIEAVANQMGKDTWTTICDLLLEENLEVAFYTFTGDMDDVRTIMSHPAQMVCSDALRIGGMPNPRTYGTYPKILGQLVRDEHLMPLEQAIRKMTSFPANRFGITDRGLLRDKMKADVVVFDPLTISGVATFE
ncbi:MAG: N-acyl-D-amino-acid deacylase family protein, partial [Chloroflexota bacterium]